MDKCEAWVRLFEKTYAHTYGVAEAVQRTDEAYRAMLDTLNATAEDEEAKTNRVPTGPLR